MGTISEKLTYLNGTKQAIKDELNRFGADLDNEDTFRSYSNVLNDIYDKLPKVSANGSDFSLENAQDGKLDSFGMDGNTEQTTYSGKNLAIFEPPASTVSGLTITYDNITGKISVKGKSNTTAGIRISAKSDTLIPNGTYTLSINSPLSSLVNYSVTDSQENNIAFRIPAGSTSVTNSLTNNGVLAQLFLVVENNVDYDLEFYLQLETGSTATSFEPYCGGTPSPNPDYPQEVKVVKGDNTINISGKNLNKTSITVNLTSGSEKWIATRLEEVNWENGKTYYIKAFLEKQSNEVVQITNYGYKNIDNKQDTIVFNGNIPYVRVGANTLNANVTNEEVKIMVSTETFTDFEPYQSQDYEIDLGDIELCKIGDYKDVIFKNNQLSSYYDSILDEDSWYVKKEIGKVVLDGSEDFDLNTSYTNTSRIAYFNFLPNQGFVGDTTGKCSHLKGKMMWSIDEEGFYTNINGLVLRFNKSTVGTIKADVQAWLSNNPVTIYYALATPTYEKITNSTLISQLESIEAFTGLNNFSVSNENNVLPTLYVSRLKELGKLE